MPVPPILVIGFGNRLLSDDGIGIYAIEELARRYLLPDDVELLDGGTSSIHLYEKLASRDRVIVADAVITDAAPGTLVHLQDEQIPAVFQSRLSPHQLSLADTLALLEAIGDAPKQITVIGMVPALVEPGSRLSTPARSRIDAMIDSIIEELRVAGITPVPQEDGRTGC